jgi:iron complex transport system ATP-binding protein
MLDLQDISCGYSSKKLLSIPKSTIGKKEVVFLVGRNGSGKSTVLKTLAGVIKPISGNVYYNNHHVTEGTSIRNRPVFMPAQNHFYQGLTGQDLFALYELQKSGWHHDEVLNSFEVQPLLSTPLVELSSGERQRIMLAATLSHQSQMVLLDEPFSFLDWKYCLQAVKIINAHAEKGRSFLISTHDFNWALKCVHSRAWLLFNHNLTEYSSMKEAVSSDIMNTIFEIECRVLENPLDKSSLLAIGGLIETK